jgi:hypothetical protein
MTGKSAFRSGNPWLAHPAQVLPSAASSLYPFSRTSVSAHLLHLHNRQSNAAVPIPLFPLRPPNDPRKAPQPPPPRNLTKITEIRPSPNAPNNTSPSAHLVQNRVERERLPKAARRDGAAAPFNPPFRNSNNALRGSVATCAFSAKSPLLPPQEHSCAPSHAPCAQFASSAQFRSLRSPDLSDQFKSHSPTTTCHRSFFPSLPRGFRVGRVAKAAHHSPNSPNLSLAIVPRVACAHATSNT